MEKVAVIVKVTEDFCSDFQHREVFGVYSDIDAAIKWVDVEHEKRNALPTARERFWAPFYEIEIKELT